MVVGRLKESTGSSLATPRNRGDEAARSSQPKTLGDRTGLEHGPERIVPGTLAG